MLEKHTWIAITKSRPLPACEIDMDGCDFYFADAFVSLEALEDVILLPSVITRVKGALQKDKLALVEVLLCARFIPEEWDDVGEGQDSLHRLAESAERSGAVVFSGFRSGEIQEKVSYRHTIREMDE